MDRRTGLDAEIVVETPFVSGRIDLALYVSRLESWADALDRLDAGGDTAWMEMSSGPSIFIQLTGERDCPEAVVEDEGGSMVTVRVPPSCRTTGLRTTASASAAAAGTPNSRTSPATTGTARPPTKRAPEPPSLNCVQHQAQ